MEFKDEHREKYEYLDDAEYYQKCMNGDFEDDEYWDNYEFTEEEYENGFYDDVQELIEQEKKEKEKQKEEEEQYLFESEMEYLQSEGHNGFYDEEIIEEDETYEDEPDIDWWESQPCPLPPEFGDCEELEEYF